MSTAPLAPVPPPIVVGLVQINNSFADQNYLPYSACVLQAYVEAHAPNRYQFLVPIYKRQPVAACVEALCEADVVAFSLYVWNFRVSLEIARLVKERNPAATIIFGGPHIPDAAASLCQSSPFIDVVVHGEGEQTFLRLLAACPDREWSGIPGISYVDETDGFIHHPCGERLGNYAELPSPYLRGTFERVMAAHPEETWIALWETNRGCPFACTFCDWGSMIQAKVLMFGEDRLRAEIDWFSDHKINYVYCCDANFGILPRDVEIAKAVAANKSRFGYPRILAVQNTKNATERAYSTQKILADAGLTNGVDLALQSVDTHTLEIIKRQNISINTYEELQRRFTRDGIPTFSDIILGLPGETYESFVKGVSHVMTIGQHNRIQFNTLSILPNAEMGDPAYQARHGMETVESQTHNTHGVLNEWGDGVFETQRIVVATAAMPREDWRRARVFAWMTAFLHFDKMLQIPLLAAHQAGASYRTLLEAFTTVDRESFPLLGEIRDFFADRARIVQEGGDEHIFSEEWLSIFWPLDEYMLVKLVLGGALGSFYAEAGRLLRDTCGESLAVDLLDDCLRLNRALLIQPMQDADVTVNLRYDVLTFYHAMREGRPEKPKRAAVSHLIERSKEVWPSADAWMREVIWYRNKNGGYLYAHVAPVESASRHSDGASHAAIDPLQPIR